jgi:AcrR family transcriptional regulator
MKAQKPRTRQAPADPRLAQSVDPRAIRTRKALQDAFLGLLEVKAFDQITPHQIAAKAGVARGSFYLHYPSKDGLLQDLAREAIATLHALGMQALDDGGSKAAALANCRHIEANRALWSALLNGGAGGVIREELVGLARDVSSRRAMPGDRLPADLGTAFSASAMMEIIAWWLRQETDCPADFVADLMVEMVFNPIRAVSSSPDLKFRYVWSEGASQTPSE